MENILDDSLTDQNHNEIRYAAFWARFSALILDGILIGAPISLIQYLFLLNTPYYWLSLLLSTIPIIYRPTMEYFYGGTFGKKIMGLKVVNLENEKANFNEIIFRNLILILYAAFAFLLGLINIVSAQNMAEGTNTGAWYDDIENNTMISLIISIVFILFSLADWIFLITDDKSRSLHNRIGRTYVIYN